MKTETLIRLGTKLKLTEREYEWLLNSATNHRDSEIRAAAGEEGFIYKWCMANNRGDFELTLPELFVCVNAVSYDETHFGRQLFDKLNNHFHKVRRQEGALNSNRGADFFSG